MMASVLQKFPDAPKCHLRLILRRFANARLNFDANFIENQFIERCLEMPARILQIPRIQMVFWKFGIVFDFKMKNSRMTTNSKIVALII